MREINRLTVHQSDSTWGDAKTIEGWHVDPNRPGGPLPGMGYHFVTLNGFRTPRWYSPEINGLIEYGRPLDQIGFHDRGQNTDSVGFCLIAKNIPTWPQLIALHETTQALRARFNPELVVEGHCENEPEDSGTECPGDRLRPRLDELRRWLALPTPTDHPGWPADFLTAVLSPPW